MYTKPWAAMDKFPMKLQRPDCDVRERLGSGSELTEDQKLVGSPASGDDRSKGAPQWPDDRHGLFAHGSRALRARSTKRSYAAHGLWRPRELLRFARAMQLGLKLLF